MTKDCIYCGVIQYLSSFLFTLRVRPILKLLKGRIKIETSTEQQISSFICKIRARLCVRSTTIS